MLRHCEDSNNESKFNISTQETEKWMKSVCPLSSGYKCPLYRCVVVFILLYVLERVYGVRVITRKFLILEDNSPPNNLRKRSVSPFVPPAILARAVLSYNLVGG